jgi:hypothetical protein
METDAAAQHEGHAEGDEVEVEDEEEYGDEYEDAHDEYEDDDGEYEDEDEAEEGEGFADGEDYGLALGRYGGWWWCGGGAAPVSGVAGVLACFGVCDGLVLCVLHSACAEGALGPDGCVPLAAWCMPCQHYMCLTSLR